MEKVDSLNVELANEILKSFPSTLNVCSLYLSGGNSKGFIVESNEYKVIAIILHKHEDYMLQRIEREKLLSIQTEKYKINVFAYDLLKALDMAQHSDYVILDILNSVVIHQSVSDVTDSLKANFTKNYEPANLFMSIYAFYQKMYNRSLKQEKKFLERVSSLNFLESMHAILMMSFVIKHLEPRDNYKFEAVKEKISKDDVLLCELLNILSETKTTEVELTENLKKMLEKLDSEVQKWIKQIKKSKVQGENMDFSYFLELIKSKYQRSA